MGSVLPRDMTPEQYTSECIALARMLKMDAKHVRMEINTEGHCYITLRLGDIEVAFATKKEDKFWFSVRYRGYYICNSNCTTNSSIIVAAFREAYDEVVKHILAKYYDAINKSVGVNNINLEMINPDKQ